MRAIEILFESSDIFYVYKATGEHTPYVYYGYSKDENVQHAFAKQGDDEVGRGSAQMIRANKWDQASIKVQIVDMFDNQYEAWVARNDLRADDPKSIVKPSHLPTSFLQHALEVTPEKVKTWKVDYIQAKTARDAYSQGRWPNHLISSLAAKFKKSDIVRDLDGMTPRDFELKYAIK